MSSACDTHNTTHRLLEKRDQAVTASGLLSRDARVLHHKRLSYHSLSCRKPCRGRDVHLLVRRCKTVSPHYINHPHKFVPGPHYKSLLCLPPPPLLPANGGPGDHRLPAVGSVAQQQIDLQICEDNISLRMKVCSWIEGKVAVCKPGGSAAWLAPKGTQRRWCPRLA